jgi:RHS repeat-associated protein
MENVSKVEANSQGQLQEQFEPFVDNQHRMYFPDARSYLSADPEHGSSAMTPGPQAYTYANGNPFKFVDPTGLAPIGMDFAASAAAHEIFNRVKSVGNDREFACLITRGKCRNRGGEFYRLEAWSEGAAIGGPAPASIGLEIDADRDVVAAVHNHPSGLGRPSGKDILSARKNAFEALYIVTLPNAKRGAMPGTPAMGNDAGPQMVRYDRDSYTMPVVVLP